MPAYSFKERFVPMILDGTKRQTIRAKRKHQVKEGDILYLFYGMRTKHCKRLKGERCVAVNDIEILQNGTVVIDGIKVTDSVLNFFAWSDGFRPEGSTEENPAGAFNLMIRFWKQTHSLPFKGDIIYW